jgi:serine protease Do
MPDLKEVPMLHRFAGRRRTSIPVLAVLTGMLLIFCLASPVLAADDDTILDRLSNAMAGAAGNAKPAVVNISTTKTVKQPRLPFSDDPVFRRFFGQGDQPQKQKVSSLGSGVIISADGYIVTCNHVIDGAEDIVVRLNDRQEYKGTVVGVDSRTDLAIIKITAANLPTITWGASDRLRSGEVVIAIGNPYGLNQTVTMGVVSATGRTGIGLADYEDFIQTDAAINPGNSGGALINTRGELIGINDAIYSTTGGNQGIGFAIPSQMVRNVMESIINQGKVVRGYLGVQIQPLTPELARQFDIKDDKGVLLVDVNEGGPAEKAGLKRGDIITRFNAKPIESPFQFKNMVAATKPGTIVPIAFIRDGKPMTATCTIGELNATPQTAAQGQFDNALKGVSVQDITDDILRQLGMAREIKGVVIVDISEESPALGLLRKGDIVMEVNRKPVRSLADFSAIVSKIAAKENVLLYVRRGAGAQYLTISPQ